MWGLWGGVFRRWWVVGGVMIIICYWVDKGVGKGIEKAGRGGGVFMMGGDRRELLTLFKDSVNCLFPQKKKRY